MSDPSSGTVIQTPRYLLRRNIILHLLRSYPAGRFLEIGCGRGELLPWLARCGFEGVGLEISEDVAPLAKEAVKPYEPLLQVVDTPELIGGEKFKYVFAFEVLEHIQDDRAALVEWKQWLDTDGTLVVSVPAHMSKWSAADEVGGHCRRYEKDGLRELLRECGYSVQVFWSYGFPVTSVTSRVRGLFYRSRMRDMREVAQEQRTLRSSLDSTYSLRTGSAPLSALLEAIGRVMHKLQLPFRKYDVGDGYIVACEQLQSGDA
jgi:SAM-dependent methyltransferase